MLISLSPQWLSCNAGDLGWIPGLGRSPGEGKGYPIHILAWEIRPWTVVSPVVAGMLYRLRVIVPLNVIEISFVMDFLVFHGCEFGSVETYNKLVFCFGGSSDFCVFPAHSKIMYPQFHLLAVALVLNLIHSEEFGTLKFLPSEGLSGIVFLSFLISLSLL